MIEFSVVVPVYQGVETLPRCLNALLHQSIDQSRYEIIVVDDGSCDQTASLAESILGSYTAQVIRAPHGGPAQARNLGAQAARSDLLLFTDADCEPALDWLERLTRVFADVTISGAKGVYRSRQRSLVARFVQQEYQDKYDRMLRLPSIDFVDTYSAAYRRAVFITSGGFDTSFTTASVEDQEFSFRLTEQGCRLVFVPDAIVYHQHDATLREYARRKYGIGYWKPLVLRRHPGKAIKDSHTPQLIKLQIVLLAIAIAATLLTILASGFAALAVSAWLLLFLTMLPLLIKIARRDAAVLCVAPLLIGLRALGLGAGLTVGLIRFNLLPRRNPV